MGAGLAACTVPKSIKHERLIITAPALLPSWKDSILKKNLKKHWQRNTLSRKVRKWWKQGWAGGRFASSENPRKTPCEQSHSLRKPESAVGCALRSLPQISVPAQQIWKDSKPYNVLHCILHFPPQNPISRLNYSFFVMTRHKLSPPGNRTSWELRVPPPTRQVKNGARSSPTVCRLEKNPSILLLLQAYS